MINSLYEQYSIYFYLGIMLLLAWPIYKNRYNAAYSSLIGVFILMCALQPFFDNDPDISEKQAFTNYAYIIGFNFVYCVGCFRYGDNTYWFWLALLTGILCGWSGINALMFYTMVSERITPDQFIAFFDNGTVAIIIVKIVMTYLLIKAADGYRGDMAIFIRNLKGDMGLLTRNIKGHRLITNLLPSNREKR